MIDIKNFSYNSSNNLVISNILIENIEDKIITFIGPSGCGKTTILNIISGLITSNESSVSLGHNNIGYMFQEDLLLPWRTLKENVKLGLEILKNDNDKIGEYISSFELSGFENYYPEELSGGMKQRAALIRTLLPSPNLILLDEPFSNLDFDIKIRIQKELLKYQKDKKATVLLVTHDIEDAIVLSDEVIILSDKPTSIKKTIPINFGGVEKNPIEYRKSYKFIDYFTEISKELKYLN